MRCHIKYLPVGYLYWTTIASRNGVRHVGAEMRGIMDDFGNLVGV